MDDPRIMLPQDHPDVVLINESEEARRRLEAIDPPPPQDLPPPPTDVRPAPPTLEDLDRVGEVSNAQLGRQIDAAEQNMHSGQNQNHVSSDEDFGMGPARDYADESMSEAAQLRYRAAQLRDAAGQKVTVDLGPNPARAPAERWAGEAHQLMGEEELLALAAENAGGDMAHARARSADDYARELRNTEIDFKARQHALYEDLDKYHEQLKRALEIHDDAVTRAANAKPSDPDIFADKGTGARVGMIIAAGLAGLGGGWNGDPDAGIRFVNNLVEREVQAQERNYKRMLNVADRRERQVEENRSVYAQMMAATGSKEASELTQRNVVLETAKAEIDAQLQHMAIGPERVKLAQLRNQLQQEINANKYKVDATLQAIPRRITARRHALNEGMRRRAGVEADNLERRAANLEEAAKSGMTWAAGTGRGQKARQLYQQKKDFEDRTRMINTARFELNKFKELAKDGDIPGFKAGVGWVPSKIRSGEGAMAFTHLKDAVAFQLAFLSGAAVTEPEFKRAAQELLFEWGRVGEERLMLQVDALEDRMNFMIENSARPMSPEALSSYLRSTAPNIGSLNLPAPKQTGAARGDVDFTPLESDFDLE